MAGRGISIDILMNVREALKGSGDVAKALGDVESTLDDLSRAGDTSTDKMARGFRDLSRDADASADNIEQNFKESYRDIARAADNAADDAVKSQRRMSERSQEVGQEIRQNLGEGIANAARGDFESLSDTIGDTLGGAVAGIGGIAAAGVAAAGAVGLGAIVAVFRLMREEAEKTEQRVSDMYDDMLESGNRYLSAEFIQKGIAEIAGDQDQYNKALQVAKDLNVDVLDVVRAMAGDQSKVSEILDEQNAKRQAEVDALAASNDTLENKSIKLDAINTKYGEQSDLFDALANAEDSAAKRFDVANSAQSAYLVDLINKAQGATKEVDALGNELYTLPTGEKILIEADTGQATTNVNNFKGDVDGILDTVTTKVELDDSAVRNYRPPRITFQGDIVMPNNGRLAMIR